MPKPILLDTNAVIHFVQAFDISKFNTVAETLQNNQCHVPIEVIAEAVYILDNVFQNDRQTTVAKLKDFINIQNNLVPEIDAVVFGLNVYASTKLDFVDCLLGRQSTTTSTPVTHYGILAWNSMAV